jgi:6-phosphogluconolactonase
MALALSGGRIAPVLYGELVRQAEMRKTRLAGADFFWADERCVGVHHEESNYRVARAALLEPMRVPAERVHRMPGDLPPDRGVERMTREWEEWVRKRGPGRGRLDLVVLGVGEDGHVASLFPGNLPADLASSAPFRSVVGPKPPPQRLTMGYRLLWEARLVLVLVTGSGKEEVVRRTLRGREDTPLGRVLRGRVDRETVLVDVG